MKITQEVREFTARQNAGVETFVEADLSTEASAKVEAGMAEMAGKYRSGGDLYVSTADS